MSKMFNGPVGVSDETFQARLRGGWGTRPLGVTCACEGLEDRIHRKDHIYGRV